MNIRLTKGTIVTVATASLIATAAYASNTIGANDLGSAAKVRSSIVNGDSTTAPVYAEDHTAGDMKEGEAKCGDKKEDMKDAEGKCGDNKEDMKDAEGKCGEGKCGDEGDDDAGEE